MFIQPGRNIKVSITYLILVIVLSLQMPNSYAQNPSEKKSPNLFVEIDSLLEHNELNPAKVLLDSLGLTSSSTQKKSNDFQVRWHQLLGKFFKKSRHRDSMQFYYQKALQQAGENYKDKSILAEINRELSKAHYGLGEFDEAKRKYITALGLYKALSDSQQIGNAYIYLGTISNIQGNSPQALDYYLEAAAMQEELENKVVLSMTYNNIGIVYKTQGDTTKSLEYHHKSLQLGREMNDSTIIARSYTSLGNAMVDVSPKKAIEHYAKAANFWEYLGKMDNAMRAYGNMGRAYVDVGKTDSAILFINRALEYNVEKNNKVSTAFNLAYLGHAYLIKGDFLTSKKYAEEAFTLGKELTYPEIIIQAAGDLVEIESTYGNYKDAFTYLSMLKNISDSVRNEANTKRITQLELEYNFEKERQKTREAQLLKEHAYEQELIREQWARTIAIVVAIFTAIMAIVVYRAFRLKNQANKKLKELRKREKILSEQALAFKERELAAMAMAAHEKNALLEDLDKKVSYVEQKLNSELKPDFKEIKKSISDGYSLDKSWDSFLHRFEDVHPNFFNHLKQEHANLTADDLKLCAYLKIGMANKEIAKVIHLTPGSVKSKINRLKKKLKMGADESVRDFMFQYGQADKIS
ncbi:MAG: tetratricopeptide repeat protein [Bacteroidota bacterium]